MTWRTWFSTTLSPRQQSVSRGLSGTRISLLAEQLAQAGVIFIGSVFRQAYSPQEVRARLHDDNWRGDTRTAAVHAAAAEASAWMGLLPSDSSREHRLGLAANRLPSVVFWYRQGVAPEDIGRRLTPFGCRCYGDRAIDAACTLIAALLNKRLGPPGNENCHRG